MTKITFLMTPELLKMLWKLYKSFIKDSQNSNQTSSGLLVSHIVVCTFLSLLTKSLEKTHQLTCKVFWSVMVPCGLTSTGEEASVINSGCLIIIMAQKFLNWLADVNTLMMMKKFPHAQEVCTLLIELSNTSILT